jgi:hypothetical protein
MRTKALNLLLLLFIAATLNAQTGQTITSTQQATTQNTPTVIPGCLTDVLNTIQMQNTPGYGQRLQVMNNKILNFDNSTRGGSVLTIPIVIHIIHNNGPENISNAQVLQGISDLNLIFANGLGGSSGANSNIQFCLARQDPNGNFTTGITRTVSPLTNMVSETQDLELKNLVRWDPTKYLNIWLVKEISSLSMGSGIAGYAYLPAAHGSAIDGIVNEAGYFGGTQLGPNTLDNSKVHVHEAGHYLGLYHTFEGGCGNNNCQIDGDRVCDTPPDNSTAAVSCFQFTANTCNTDDDDLSNNNPYRPIANGGLGDQDDMIGNYMDYGYQICQYYFTQNQCDRMNAALTTSRASLLQSQGCNDACLTPLNTQFTASDTTIFIGGQVTFTITNPNANYTWYVDGVASGSGANFTYNNNPAGPVGNYVINVTATNGDIACVTSNSFTVKVECQAKALYTVTSLSPYNVGETITTVNNSTSATSYAWVLDGIVQNANTNFSQQFNAPGGHNLFLVAYNGNCADTSSTTFFSVGNCNISGMNQNWFFNNISLNFNNGMGEPTVGNSPLNIDGQESTTTISDPDGNLLFYSDGIRVYNRNNVIMPNGSGLMGSFSTTQSCLATPFPGNPNLYYLFTADAIENNLDNGIRYNIIDMTLNNGLGDVVSGSKNILVRDDVGEMLTGTFHANGRDIWILMAKSNSNQFYAYLLTDQGISTNPVISSQIGQNTSLGLGPMKFSADGNMVACTMLRDWPWSIVLANFNRTTGELTNGRDIWLSDVVNNQPHSFEFSPDNSKLYVNLWQPNEIWQYDLSVGNINAITASKTVVSPYPTGPSYGQMARGNNGKIYMTSASSLKVDYIANPNATGLACNYTTGTISAYVSGLLMSFSIPNMIQGLGQPYIPSIAGKTAICPGEQVTYNVPYLTSDQSVVWTYTGNGTLTNNTNNTATLTNVTGIGQLRVTVTGGCGITHDTIVISAVPAIHPFIGNDTLVCGAVQLSTQIPFAHYLWNTGDIGTILLATPPGTYWVETTDTNGCVATDTIVLNTTTSVPVNLGANTAICNGNDIVLSPGPGYQSYEWQDGATDSTYTVTEPGTYWVSVSDGCGTATDTITIGQSQINFELMLNNDTVACKTALPFALNAPGGYSSYLWQNGNASQSINVTAVGTYWLRVTDNNGCIGIDTFRVVDCTGIAENTVNPIRVYPNPANGQLTINLNGNAPVQFTLMDTAGQILLNQNITGITTLNTLSFANGIYMARVSTGNRTWHQKIIILH